MVLIINERNTNNGDYMNDKKIIEYIENEVENEYLDFKAKPYNWKQEKEKCEFLKDILSFANSNSKIDKYIILGVKIKKDGSRDFRGINKDEMEDSAEYQQLVSENIEPSISVETYIINYKEKKYGIIRIFNCDNRPYLMRKKYGTLETGFTRIRRGSRNCNMSRYLLDEIYELKNNKISSFKIYGLNNGKTTPKIVLKTFDYPNLVKEKENIIELVNKINMIRIDDVKDENNNDDTNNYLKKITNLSNSNKSIMSPQKIEVDENSKKIIKDFSKTIKLKLSDNFFDVGNASKKFKGFGRNGMNLSISYENEGSKKSIEKINMISELLERIEHFKSWTLFIDETKNIKYLELVIEETENTDDEDIEINMELPKGIYVNIDDFPIPNDSIISEINKKYSEKMFKPYIKDNISEYRGNPKQKTNMQKYSSLPINYYDVEVLDGLYDYIDYEIEDYYDKTVLRFNIKNIKQKEKMVFPGNILIKGELNTIKYYIISKNSKKKMEGILQILDK